MSRGEGRRGAEKERENLKKAPHLLWSPTWGWIPWPWVHDLSWKQESESQLTEPPRSPCFVLFFWRFFFFLSNLYTQRGTQTHNPEGKNHTLHRLSQPVAPKSLVFNWDILDICLCVSLKKFFLMFIMERQSMSMGGAERGGTQNLRQAPGSELSAQSWRQGSNPWTVRSWPEPKSDA